MGTKWIGFTVLMVILCWGRLSFGNQGFGMVFDLAGEVEMQSPGKQALKLVKNRHLLYSVKEGDKFTVGENGKLLIVSFSDSKGFELGPGATAIIRNNRIEASKGKMTTKEGYHAPLDVPGVKPKEAAARPIGAVIMRSTHKPCVRLLSPVNTIILDRAPVLKWENDCREIENFSVAILHQSKEIASYESGVPSLQMPKGVIEFGKTYDWLVKETVYHGIVGGRFALPSEEETRELNRLIGKYRKEGDSLPDRLSLIFLLSDNYLYEMAAQEVAKLQQDYPEAQYIEGIKQP